MTTAYDYMMSSYTTASGNCAEAAFACENMSASVIIMGAAVAALFFVIFSVLAGSLLTVLIGLSLIIVRLIITPMKSPKESNLLN